MTVGTSHQQKEDDSNERESGGTSGKRIRLGAEGTPGDGHERSGDEIRERLHPQDALVRSGIGKEFRKTVTQAPLLFPSPARDQRDKTWMMESPA